MNTNKANTNKANENKANEIKEVTTMNTTIEAKDVFEYLKGEELKNSTSFGINEDGTFSYNMEQAEEDLNNAGTIQGEMDERMQEVAEAIIEAVPEVNVTGHIKRNKLVVRRGKKVVARVKANKRGGNVTVWVNDKEYLTLEGVEVVAEPESSNMTYSAKLTEGQFEAFLGKLGGVATEEEIAA